MSSLENRLRQRSVLTWQQLAGERRELTSLLDAGTVTRILRGVFCLTSRSNEPGVRVDAIAAFDPRAVFTGWTAAALGYPEVGWPKVISFTSPRRWSVRRPWLSARYGSFPPERITGTPRRTKAADTVLDMLTSTDSSAIEIALRRGWTSLPALNEALAARAGQAGTRMLRRHLADTRDTPWSIPERGLHTLLRAHRITGWTGNLRVHTDLGFRYLDVGFPELRLGLELDSFQYHGDAAAFEGDRERHNELTASGWTVLYFTPAMITDEPDRVIEVIRRVRRRLSR